MKNILSITIFGIAFMFTGAINMLRDNNLHSTIYTTNPQYYLGMTFPKYSHPAKLYDEIDLKKVEEIKNSQEVISYYAGFYENNKLIKFEKFINSRKIFEFTYTYDSKGSLIKIENKKFE